MDSGVRVQAPEESVQPIMGILSTRVVTGPRASRARGG